MMWHISKMTLDKFGRQLRTTNQNIFKHFESSTGVHHTSHNDLVSKAYLREQLANLRDKPVDGVLQSVWQPTAPGADPTLIHSPPPPQIDVINYANKSFVEERLNEFQEKILRQKLEDLERKILTNPALEHPKPPPEINVSNFVNKRDVKKQLDDFQAKILPQKLADLERKILANPALEHPAPPSPIDVSNFVYKSDLTGQFVDFQAKLLKLPKLQNLPSAADLDENLRALEKKILANPALKHPTYFQDKILPRKLADLEKKILANPALVHPLPPLPPPQIDVSNFANKSYVDRQFDNFAKRMLTNPDLNQFVNNHLDKLENRILTNPALKQQPSFTSKGVIFFKFSTRINKKAPYGQGKAFFFHTFENGREYFIFPTLKDGKIIRAESNTDPIGPAFFIILGGQNISHVQNLNAQPILGGEHLKIYSVEATSRVYLELVVQYE